MYCGIFKWEGFWDWGSKSSTFKLNWSQFLGMYTIIHTIELKFLMLELSLVQQRATLNLKSAIALEYKDFFVSRYCNHACWYPLQCIIYIFKFFMMYVWNWNLNDLMSKHDNYLRLLSSCCIKISEMNYCWIVKGMDYGNDFL